MVVNCPNCECPNDADIERCRQCGARIPWTLREQAMGQRKKAVKKTVNYDDGMNQVHRSEQKQVVRVSRDDSLGRRSDVRSLRGELRDVDGPISSTSPADKYGPPPTHQTAARSASGRAYVDDAGYQQSVGRTHEPHAAPMYSDRATWEANQRNLRTAEEAGRAQIAAQHAGHNQVLLHTQPDSSFRTHEQAGRVAPRVQEHAAHQWHASQHSVPSEAETARALAASGSSDPMAAVSMGAAADMTPPPPSRRSASALRGGNSQDSEVVSDGYTRAPTQATSQAHAPSRPSYEPSAPAPAYTTHAPKTAGPVAGEAEILDPEERKKRRKRAPVGLVFLDANGNRKEVLPLRPGKTIIGRTEGEVLLRSDEYVSPWHAQISVTRNGVSIKDMYSLNGIFRRIKRQAVLQDGDRFMCGRQLLKFRHGWSVANPDGQGTKPFGSPHPASGARVLVLTDSEEVADQRIIREMLTIGRTACDISVPEDDLLADKHVQIHRDRAEYLLIDLNSPGGVFLAIRGEAELHDGDIIQIGRQRLMIDIQAQG